MFNTILDPDLLAVIGHLVDFYPYGLVEIWTPRHNTPTTSYIGVTPKIGAMKTTSIVLNKQSVSDIHRWIHMFEIP